MEKLNKLIIITIIFIFSLAYFTKNAHAFPFESMDVICREKRIERFVEGDVYGQTFVSTVDTFGYLMVQLSNFNTQSDDQLIFRIKEFDSEEWYSEDKYRLDLFENDQFYMFDFFPFIDVKEKTFLFELEVVSGEDGVPVGLYLSKTDCRENAQAYLNGEEIEGDIIFKIATGESIKQRFIQDKINNFTSDPYFFVFWSILVIGSVMFVKKY